MAVRLKGWRRLWIVLTILYGGVAAVTTAIFWPRLSHVEDAPWLIFQMSDKARVVVDSEASWNEAPVAVIDGSNQLDQFAKPPRKLVEVRLPNGTIVKNLPQGVTRTEVADRLEAKGYLVPEEWTPGRMPVYQAPNGHKFRFAHGTKAQDIELVHSEYERVLHAALVHDRWVMVGKALLWWIVPSLLCALGLAAGWVLRRFSRERHEA